MQVTSKRVKNLSFLVIDDFFNTQELQEVEKEIQDLKRFFLHSKLTGAAHDEHGALKKTGSGIFLDNLYRENREASSILHATRKVFTVDFVESAESFDAVFGFIRESNFDNTLLNYYVRGQEYKAHRDASQISLVIFLREGAFTGGEFKFPSQDIEIESVHNRAVVFPSCVLHQAMPVYGDGARVSIAKLIEHKY